jgi:hypothetical protein
MLIYRLLADLLVTIHLLYAGFVVFGLLAVLAGIVFRWQWTRNFWFRTIHFLMIGVVVLEVFVGLDCPLTALEWQWRDWGGQEFERTSFIGRCVGWVLFYELPPWVFDVVYCLFGAAVLATLVLAPPRLPPWLLRFRRPAAAR